MRMTGLSNEGIQPLAYVKLKKRSIYNDGVERRVD